MMSCSFSLTASTRGRSEAIPLTFAATSLTVGISDSKTGPGANIYGFAIISLPWGPSQSLTPSIGGTAPRISLKACRRNATKPMTKIAMKTLNVVWRASDLPGGTSTYLGVLLCVGGKGRRENVWTTTVWSTPTEASLTHCGLTSLVTGIVGGTYFEKQSLVIGPE